MSEGYQSLFEDHGSTRQESDDHHSGLDESYGTTSVCTDFMARLLSTSRCSGLETKWCVTDIETDRAK